MRGAERFFVLGAVVYMAVYIPCFFLVSLDRNPDAAFALIMPFHLVGMLLNLTALVLTIRDLYLRRFDTENAKLTWLLVRVQPLCPCRGSCRRRTAGLPADPAGIPAPDGADRLPRKLRGLARRANVAASAEVPPSGRLHGSLEGGGRHSSRRGRPYPERPGDRHQGRPDAERQADRPPAGSPRCAAWQPALRGSGPEPAWQGGG